MSPGLAGVEGGATAELRTTQARPETSLIGRTAELERLQHRAELARQGQGGVVFLVGEAGIGKTALLDEFLRWAQQGRSLTVVQARCVEHSGPGEAYLPLLDALGRLLASRARERTIEVLRSCAPTWALHMPADVIRPSAPMVRSRGRRA